MMQLYAENNLGGSPAFSLLTEKITPQKLLFLKVHNDVLHALDDGECVFLVLLDLSGAFNTIDHTRLQKRLTDSFGILCKLVPPGSYLSDRKQAVYVTVCGVESKENTLKYDLSQGSVLGLVFFKDNITPVADLISSHDVQFHGHTDDTQLYVTFKPDGVASKSKTRKQKTNRTLKKCNKQARALYCGNQKLDGN